MHSRWVALILAGIFTATLAVVVAWRLSSEAMAVLVGVVAGVVASIPTSLLVVWVTARQWRVEREAREARDTRSMPSPPPSVPVVVVAPPAGQPQSGLPGWSNAYMPSPGAPRLSQREFSVIGGEAQWQADSLPSAAPRAEDDTWRY